MKRLIVVTVVVLCAATLAQAQTGVRGVIETNVKQFVEAFNKGDADAVANWYLMDARVMPSNSDIVQGRANIKTFWQGAIAAGVKLVSLDPIDIEVHGNTAIEVGRYTMTTPAAGGATTTDKGKYVVVWKRQGRGWKIATDIFNSSLPAAP